MKQAKTVSKISLLDKLPFLITQRKLFKLLVVLNLDFNQLKEVAKLKI